MFTKSRRLSQKRKVSKVWREACAPSPEAPYSPPPLTIKATNLDSTSQNLVQEITKQALEMCGVENEIATFIKTKTDESLGPNWHCIVGRNFGSHIVYESYIYFSVAKITIILFKCG